MLDRVAELFDGCRRGRRPTRARGRPHRPARRKGRARSASNASTSAWNCGVSRSPLRDPAGPSRAAACLAAAAGSARPRPAPRAPGVGAARRSLRGLSVPVLKPLLDDPAKVCVGCFQHGTASNVEGELFQLGETRAGQLVGDGSRGVPEVAAEARLQALEVLGRLGSRRGRSSARIWNRRQAARSRSSPWLVAPMRMTCAGSRSICSSSVETTRLISPVSCSSERSLAIVSSSSKKSTQRRVRTNSKALSSRAAVSPEEA